MSSGGGTNVQQFDPTEYEAELQNKRMELTDKITKRAFGAAKEANVYGEVALKSLDEGLGLLSNYLDRRVDAERINLDLSENAKSRGMNLRQEMQAGAGFLTGYAADMLQKANKADKSFRHSKYGQEK